MPVHYIDFNKQFIPEKEAIVTSENRAFRYGDGLFETMRWMDGDIRFLSHHVSRLQGGVRLLQLEHPAAWDVHVIRSRAADLSRKSGLEGQHVRVRLQFYRDGEGLYSPQQNQAAYVMSVAILDPDDAKHRKIGL